LLKKGLKKENHEQQRGQYLIMRHKHRGCVGGKSGDSLGLASLTHNVDSLTCIQQFRISRNLAGRLLQMIKKRESGTFQ